MSENMAPFLASAVGEVARAMSKTQTERARYEYLAGTSRQVAAPLVSSEETVPGVELNSYVNRTQVEGGSHVLVVEHKEHLEKVKPPIVPLTEEEIAQEREQKRFIAKIWAGVVTAGIVVAGVVIVVDRKKKLPQLEVK